VHASTTKNDIELHFKRVRDENKKREEREKNVGWWYIKEILSNFGNLLSLFFYHHRNGPSTPQCLLSFFHNDTLFAHLSRPIKIVAMHVVPSVISFCVFLMLAHF
jgi:hypothetical protein